jgi:hypothetical protein
MPFGTLSSIISKHALQWKDEESLYDGISSNQSQYSRFEWLSTKSIEFMNELLVSMKSSIDRLK